MHKKYFKEHAVHILRYEFAWESSLRAANKSLELVEAWVGADPNPFDLRQSRDRILRLTVGPRKRRHQLRGADRVYLKKKMSESAPSYPQSSNTPGGAFCSNQF
eukprot:gb/GEZN01020198.1/.p1 GENE.gb/GEZN01020198.1/~~gb/GEZN01020198.1/.p1  ORF type:complete len:104 (-),score=3.87 gb/GEZN01020198.1/:152-463(-)